MPFFIYIIGKVAIMSRQAQTLKKSMKAKRINQADFARLLQISPSHLCKVIKGQRRLGKMAAIQVAEIIDVPDNEILAFILDE